jgi:hypothetical protein
MPAGQDQHAGQQERGARGEHGKPLVVARGEVGKATQHDASERAQPTGAPEYPLRRPALRAQGRTTLPPSLRSSRSRKIDDSTILVPARR